MGATCKTKVNWRRRFSPPSLVYMFSISEVSSMFTFSCWQPSLVLILSIQGWTQRYPLAKAILYETYKKGTKAPLYVMYMGAVKLMLQFRSFR